MNSLIFYRLIGVDTSNTNEGALLAGTQESAMDGFIILMAANRSYPFGIDEGLDKTFYPYGQCVVGERSLGAGISH